MAKRRFYPPEFRQQMIDLVLKAWRRLQPVQNPYRDERFERAGPAKASRPNDVAASGFGG